MPDKDTVQSSTDTLTEEAVASRYTGLSEDQVHAFCREFGIPKDGDHYVIPTTMLPQLERWADRKGIALNAGG